MRITFLNMDPVPFTFGGVYNRVKGLSEELAKRGHDVHIISARPMPGQEPIEAPEGVEIHRVGLPYVTFQGPRWSLPLRILYRPFMVLAWWACAAVKLLELGADMVDCQDPIFSALPAFGKHLITPHGIFGKNTRTMYENSPLRYLVSPFLWIQYFNLFKCSGMIALGKEERLFYSKWKKGFIVENGVDIDRFKPCKGCKEEELGRNIVYIGRLSYEKNVTQIVKMMRYLPDFTLTIVGTGPEEAKLKSIAGKNVRFIGFQSKVEDYLHDADYFVMASLFENLPFSLLEALSCGKICLSTPVGEIRNIIRHERNGFFFHNDDPQMMALLMRQVSQFEPEELVNIQKRARATIVADFSWKQKAEEAEAVYNAVLSNS